MTNGLKVELIKVNEAIDMIETALEIHKDVELQDRLDKLRLERDELLRQIGTLN